MCNGGVYVIGSASPLILPIKTCCCCCSWWWCCRWLLLHCATVNASVRSLISRRSVGQESLYTHHRIKPHKTRFKCIIHRRVQKYTASHTKISHKKRTMSQTSSMLSCSASRFFILFSFERRTARNLWETHFDMSVHSCTYMMRCCSGCRKYMHVAFYALATDTNAIKIREVATSHHTAARQTQLIGFHCQICMHTHTLTNNLVSENEPLCMSETVASEEKLMSEMWIEMCVKCANEVLESMISIIW